MTKIFKNATAFRTSLEQRLKDRSHSKAVPLQSLRIKLGIERLLARLFHDHEAPWYLKGGYAMELRYRPRARATRDIDLTALPRGEVKEARVDAIRERLQQAAEEDPGDYFVFEIGVSNSLLDNAPGGGARFPVVTKLAGREFVRFHLDVGFGDPIPSPIEELVGDDYLDFAGIAPARVRAISKAQQFAEKIHAYTFPWKDRVNTRSRDLIDLLIFVETEVFDPTELVEALRETFQRRKSHSLPDNLPDPPVRWEGEFAAMAHELGFEDSDLMSAAKKVQDYFRQLPMN